MSNRLNQVLDQFEGRPDVSLRVLELARELELARDGVIVRVTVPDDVLEWFVDVTERDCVVAQDWVDYEGYDDTPPKALAESMTEDIAEFLEKLLQRDLRLAPGEPGIFDDFARKYFRRKKKPARKKCILEWEVGGAWKRAVPFPWSD